MKEDRYFLFGSEACSDFEDNSGEVTEEHLEYLGYATLKVTSETTASEIIDATIGWNDYLEITEEQYLKL